MPSISPVALALDGTEALPLNIDGRGGTVTLAQLQQQARGAPIGAGIANPPVGLPAVQSLAGFEQLRVFSTAAGGWCMLTIDQLISWAKTGNVPPFVLAPGGGGLGGLPRATALADGDAIMVQQAGGLRAASLAAVRALLTA